MIRPVWKSLLIAAVVSAVVGLSSAESRAAWWWGTWQPAAYGSHGWGAWSAAPGGWYVGVRPGPIRRLLFGPYRYYYVPYAAPYGWSACSTCWAAPCACSTVHYSAPVVYDAVPSYLPDAPVPRRAPEDPAYDLPGPASYVPTAEESGILTIFVPADARVIINGHETRSTGSQRRYVSYGLEPGYSYEYEVHAEIVRDGEIIEDVRTVHLTAGAREAVAFGFNPEFTESLAALP